jgi:hypothetical protein
MHANPPQKSAKKARKSMKKWSERPVFRCKNSAFSCIFDRKCREFAEKWAENVEKSMFKSAQLEKMDKK